MAIEVEKINVKMNKPIYLSMSILDISKTLMYKFWYDYIKLKCQWRVALKKKSKIMLYGHRRHYYYY